MKRYADVNSIFSVESISNGHLKALILGRKRFVYFFKIEPIIVINEINYSKEEIIAKYEEFLRNLNLDFQILIQTEKIDIHKYLEHFSIQNEDKKFIIRKNYVENVESLLQNSKIYVTNYYIVISSEKEENVERYFKIFNESELIVKKIISKSEIENIITKGVEMYK